jgi:hypothetical protein
VVTLTTDEITEIVNYIREHPEIDPRHYDDPRRLLEKIRSEKM